jgi:hypothetical protein
MATLSIKFASRINLQGILGTYFDLNTTLTPRFMTHSDIEEWRDQRAEKYENHQNDFLHDQTAFNHSRSEYVEV